MDCLDYDSYYESVLASNDCNQIVDLGLQYFENKIYCKALPLLEQGFELGNFKTCIFLGYLYSMDGQPGQSGQSELPNYKKSYDMYDFAIKQNIYKERALCGLGTHYILGYGVKKDYTKALQLYQQAYDLGLTYALRNIGEMYRDGMGVPQDYEKAIKYFKISIENGVISAITDLAILYKDGLGFEKKNPELAIAMFQLAIHLNPDNSTDYRAQNHLGTMYRDGIGSSVNYDKAFQLFQQASESNNTDGIINLSDMYRLGLGVPTDLAKATELLNIVINRKNSSDKIMERLDLIHKEQLNNLEIEI